MKPIRPPASRGRLRAPRADISGELIDEARILDLSSEALRERTSISKSIDEARILIVGATLALCLTLQMSNLGAHLGEHFASRDPHHLDRWRVALIAGLAQKRCAAIARSTGLRCRGTPLKFSTKCRCHCLGSERIAVDAKRLSWLERQLPRTGNAKVRANIEARIARIERRRLRWVWRTDPTVEGATISLEPPRPRARSRMAALGRRRC